MQVDFYQLTRDPSEKLVVQLCTKIMDSGQACLILSNSDTQLEVISEALWNAAPDSFLAHGFETGEAVDAVQPILLARSLNDANKVANKPTCLILADGEWVDAAAGDFARIFYPFMPNQIDAARDRWREVTAMENVEPRFWKQEAGRWTQVA